MTRRDEDECERGRHWRGRRQGAVAQALALFLVTLVAQPPVAAAPRPGPPTRTLALPAGESSLAPADGATRAGVEAGLGKLPLYFIENRGQIDSRVAYYVQGVTNALYFTKTGIVFAMASQAREGHDSEARPTPASFSPRRPRGESAAIRRYRIGLEFEGANPEVKLVGRERTSAVVSYFKGRPSEWKTALATYAGVAYEELWPGIDLVYGSESGQPKYTFLVKPGADPSRIHLVYRGASGVRLTEEGRLAVETPAGGFTEERPFAYQEGQADTKTEVEAAFAPEAGTGAGEYRFGFRVGTYDRTRPLVLDPVVLAYCGYIGGSQTDQGYGIAVDSLGNAYVTGDAYSTETQGFPVVPGSWDVAFGSAPGTDDAFVAKINAAGTALVYCGYIGGSGYDLGNGVAVDASGNAYVVGNTTSPDLPTTGVTGTTWLHWNTNAGGGDAFVAKINAAGTALVYCGYLGGSKLDRGTAIAVDGPGNAYVTGQTASKDSGSASGKFPVTVGPDLTYNGTTDPDAFVAKINAATPTDLVYCGYIGGSGDDYGNGIAVDGSGSAYVTGSTVSTNLPVLAAAWPHATTFSGAVNDAFVAKVKADGTALVYCGYVGGSGNDEGLGIAVDGSGNAYMTGYTASTQADVIPFPVLVGPGLTHHGSYDAFVAKVNAAGTALVYCGYIGGSGTDDGDGIAVDGSGNAYVAGNTTSFESDGFPVTAGPDLTYNGGTTDAFVAKVNAAGTALIYCGYIGGSGGDVSRGIALDGSGNAYVVGYTDSTEAQGFPVAVGPDLTYNAGSDDAFVAKLTVTATAVTLESFWASAMDSAVEVSWETASELDNLGFHLYQGVSADGPWTRLNASMIPGLGSSPEGRQYRWVDAGLLNGRNYFYRLEDVDRHGEITSHGPVSATPVAGLVDPGGGSGDGSGSGEPPGSPTPTPAPERKTHGDPTQQSLRVLGQTTSGMTLELVTGGFYSETQPDGTSKLFVPGFFDQAEPGLPAVPTRRLWVDATVGRGVRLVSVEPSQIVSFPGLDVSLAGRPLAVAASDGTYRASSIPLREQARRLAKGPGEVLFPASLAFVHHTAFQGERKKAYVELAPLQVDHRSGAVTLARRLLVRLAFTGRALGETGRGSLGRRDPLPSEASPPQLLARLATCSRGLYSIAFEQIPGLSSPISPSELRLSRLGAPVAFHLEPPRQPFGPGSILFFLAQGTDSAYANEAVYELAIGPGGLQMPGLLPSRHVPPTTPLTLLRQERSFESNATYLPALLEARDLWLWDYGIAGGQGISYPFTLDSPPFVPETARLTLDLQGGSDTEVDPDHHVLAFVNGSLVGETRFDGMVPHSLTVEFSSSLLLQGENTLLLENAGDTGSTASFVYLDRFSIDLAQPIRSPLDGRLEGRASERGRVRLSAPRGSLVLDLTGSTPRFLARARADGDLVWNAEAGHDYLVVSPQAFLAPEVRPTPSTALRSQANQADWILVAPQAFVPAAQPLVALRQSQGLSATAVSYDALVDEFGYGETGPHALKNFFSFAFHHWNRPSPRYVLLLGDASYDPRGYLSGTSRPDVIPSPLTKSTFLWTASDPLYAAVNGEDSLPDFAIGRITAATPEEARAAVQKILDFESSGQSLAGKAALASDNPDIAGNFEDDQNDIASLLTSRPVEKIYLSQYGNSGSATKAAVLNAFDSGLSLMSYVGHGSSGLWASEGILRSPDVASFAPQPAQPLVLTMTCSNGYFLSPYYNSLAERLVLAPDRGAIAAFSPSGLSLNDPAHLYNRAVVQELENGTHARLGDLLLAAQADYAATGAFPELLSLYHLFGDPGLRIR